MERIRELGLDELIAERRDAGVPILGICLGLQLLFDSTTELGGGAGLGLLPGEVAELDAQGLKVPHIGWSPVRWEQESRLTEGIESETPFYLVHSFAPRPAAADLLGTAAYGARFACAAERDNVFGVQFHPEKSSAAGLRLLSNFAGVCAAAPAAGVILYPAIDIRGGQAVRLLQGDYERETDLRRRPGRRGDALGRRRGGVPARGRPRRGESGRAAEPGRGARGSQPRSSARSRSAAACATLTSVDAVLEAGAERVVIGTAALRDPEFLDAMRQTPHGERVVVSVDARDGKVALAGWTEAGEEGVVEAVAALSERGVARFLCTAIEVDGTMEGPALDELNRIAAATQAQVIASGGVGELAHLESLAREAPANIEGAIVGRALYERKFTVAEGIAALRQ